MKLINTNKVNLHTVNIESIQAGQCFEYENDIYMMCALGSLQLAQDLDIMSTLTDYILATRLTDGEIYMIKIGTPVIPIQIDASWNYFSKVSKHCELISSAKQIHCE